MDRLEWNEQLNIGIEVIDKAHANLFRIVEKLTQLTESDSNYQNACKEGIKYLEDYTMKHFSEEEAYMRSVHYRGYEKHKQIHDIFRDQTLVSLKKTLKLSQYSQVAAQRFLGTLLGWLTGHIMVEDQAITAETFSGKIYDDSSETSIVAQAVNQAVQEIFHMSSNLVDVNYNGRNMGMKFFCRLCYNTDDGGKVQILFGAEEHLIRRGVGLILGFQAMQDAALVQEASLQIFEQFLHYMSKLFKSDAAYQIDRDELLTGDEFRSDFMTRYPYHMLFETRLGHFVFCARKWEVKRKGVRKV